MERTQKVQKNGSTLGEENSDFEAFFKEELDRNLWLFFASLRSTEGKNLKSSTFYTVRYGLSKYLKDKCSIDIMSVDFAFFQ